MDTKNPGHGVDHRPDRRTRPGCHIGLLRARREPHLHHKSVPLGATCQTRPDRPVSVKVLVSALP